SFPGENDLVSRFFSQPMEGAKDSSSRRQNNGHFSQMKKSTFRRTKIDRKRELISTSRVHSIKLNSVGNQIPTVEISSLTSSSELPPGVDLISKNLHQMAVQKMMLTNENNLISKFIKSTPDGSSEDDMAVQKMLTNKNNLISKFIKSTLFGSSEDDVNDEISTVGIWLKMEDNETNSNSTAAPT
ncbi:hypothetical protein L9F63_009564, partial [Diploptera punctata]